MLDHQYSHQDRILNIYCLKMVDQNIESIQTENSQSHKVMIQKLLLILIYLLMKSNTQTPKLFALIILIATIHVSSSITWFAPEGIRTGLITPFTTFTQQNQTVNYIRLYNQSLTDPARQAGISLVGFAGIVSSFFYYITNINSFDLSSISIAVTVKTQTYLTRLNFNYIVIGDPIHEVYLDLFTGCFLCTNLSSGNGTRNQIFSLQTHRTSNIGQMIISTSVSGFNISTSDGSSFQFQVQSWMTNNSKTIYQQITALDYTKVQLMCLTTIIYDITAGNQATTYSLVVQNISGIVDQSNQASDIKTVPIFQDMNHMFFGISAMNLGLLQAVTQDLYIDTDSYTDLNVNFSATSNVIAIRFSGFYIAERDCTAGQYYNPQTYTCVAACSPPLYSLLPQMYCGLCAQTCQSCNGSLSNQCKTCKSSQNRQFNSASRKCECKAQFYQVGQSTCASCNSLISGCQTCTNKTFCQTCISPLSVNSSTGKCQCANNKYLVSNICLSYPGCLIAGFASNAIYCDKCDGSLNFIRLTSNLTCACLNNFQPINGTCLPQCGDGILSGSQCDDANIDNGDGCSSTCAIQQGWSCYYNATLIKSVCTINTTFSVNYLYSARSLLGNIVYIYFQLTPAFKSLEQMDFAKYCSLSFQYQSLSSAYDSSTGILTLSVNYLQQVQEKSSIFSLNFDDNLVTAPPISQPFTPTGKNSLLTYDSFAQQNALIAYGSLALSVIMWIVAIAGSISGQKMVSIQLMLPFQLVYLFLVCSESKISSIQSLQFLKFSTGYNSLNGLSVNQININDQNAIFSDQYVQNYNFMMILNFGILLFILIMRVIQLFKYKKVKEYKNSMNVIRSRNKIDKLLTCTQIQLLTIKYDQAMAKLKSLRGFTNNLIDKVFLIVLCGSLLLGTFNSSYVSSQKFPNHYQYSMNLNYLACQIGLLVSSLILVLIIDEKSDQISFEPLQEVKYAVGKIFVAFYVLQSVLLVVMYLGDVPYLILINLLISLVPLGYFIIKNPYKKQGQIRNFPWIASLFNMILFTVPLALLSITKVMPVMSQQFYLGTSIAILGCCLSAQILAVIRIFKHYKISISQIKKVNKLNNKNMDLSFDMDQDKMAPPKQIKSNLLTLQNNDQMINWQEKHQQQYESIQREKSETHESLKKIETEDVDNADDQDLALIKKKLRADLISKRGFR